MPSDHLSNVEGSGVPVDRNGRGRRRRSPLKHVIRSRHQVSRRLVVLREYCSGSDSPDIACRTGCLSPSRNCKAFRTKEPPDAAPLRVISFNPAGQLFLFWLVSVHCCMLFYGSCLSTNPNLSLSTDGDIFVTRASSPTTTPADSTGATAPDRANISNGKPVDLENAAYSSSAGPRPAGFASGGADVGVGRSRTTKPAATSVFSLYEGLTDAAPRGSLTSSSLLSLEQTTASPLPAGYQTYKEMLELLRTLASSCPELTLTDRRSGALKVDIISLKRSSPDNKSRVNVPQLPPQRIFILSGEHPRELVPSAVLVRFVQLVCGARPPALPATAEAGSQQQQTAEEITSEQGNVRAYKDGGVSETGNRNGGEQHEDGEREGDLRRYPRLLDNAEFEIILNANPLARERVEEGDLCRRGTLSNVDINRNWSAFWEADTPEPLEATSEDSSATSEERGAAEQYLTGGPSPFSEPETQLLRQALLQFQPTLFISLHSGQLGVFTPFGHSEQKPTTHGQRLKQIAAKVARNPYCKNPDSSARCVTGIAGEYFSAKGNCLDWVYTTILPTPLAFLMEIYKGEGATVPKQPELPFTKSPEYKSPLTQEVKEGGGLNRESTLIETDGDSKSEIHLEHPSTIIPTGRNRSVAQNPQSWDVRTSENTFSAQRLPLRRPLFRASRLAQISPHSSFASVKQKVLHTIHGSGRAARISFPPETAPSVFSDTPSLSSNGRNSSRRNNGAARHVNGAMVSLMELKHGSAGSSVAGAHKQISTGVHPPEECFRLFNPHTHISREEALDGWSEVLLQLINEVQSTATSETSIF